MNNKNIYLEEVLINAPRLLSLLDRNLLSKTYGSFDRQYWHYKTSDFSCARMQEATLTLTLLFKLKHQKNPYYNNNKIIDLINASLNYWTKIQEKNGSFNEWYPKENSFVATAFSSYAISETLLELGNLIKNKKEIINSLKRSASWLENKDEFQAQNQESGAAIFLYNLYLLTNEDKYKELARKKIEFILKNQTDEGWYFEYGGADIGYLSLTIDYLSKYYKKTKDKEVLEALKRSLDFISYFIHPNLTFGGIYGSRNTAYLIPHGFEILSFNTLAKTISTNIKTALLNKTTISPSILDDKYLCYITYTYLQAFTEPKNNTKITTPKYKKFFIKNFEHAGLLVFSNPEYYLIINYKKGGVMNLFFKTNNKTVLDSGIEIKTNHNKNLISSFLTKSNKIELSNSQIVIKGNFCFIKNNIQTPLKNITLRLFQLTIGKNQKIALKIKEILRKYLITQPKKSDIHFKRTIQFKKNQIKIIDLITGPQKIREVILSDTSSYIYIPSSNYFQRTEINSNSEQIRIIPPKTEIKIKRIFSNIKKITTKTI